MHIREVELKKVEIKSLASLDKSVRLVFDVNLHDGNDVDVNGIHAFLYKPLKLEIQEDG